MLENSSILVHFSTMPRMNRHNSFFPNDLRASVNNSHAYDLPCCCIKPGDSREMFAGEIGIIIDPVDITSIGRLSYGDGGSGVTGNGKREGGDNDPTINNIELLFSRRTGYNEIFISNYKVVGIFVYLNSDGTSCYVTENPREDELEGLDQQTRDMLWPNQSCNWATPAEIQNLFAGLSVFTLSNEGYMIFKRGRFFPNTYADLYRSGICVTASKAANNVVNFIAGIFK